MKKNILSLLLLVNLANGDFIRDNGNNIVIDTSTNLMWQDDGDTNTLTKTWSLANTYCEDLDFASFTDWKLPNQKELISIGDKSIDTPAIYVEFVNKNSEKYWSSSTYKNGATNAWFVGFNDAYSWVNAKTAEFYVRCVRYIDLGD